ncbi:hypothetical protein [Ferruginivarius sediminum]|uniref:hypothetical protein n=1 Tax=Ferruginivarius sediminum TaxID=2661937 RepID=UPI0012935D70|nr:hypothetical protein [Ferruginivarius sediminum]
MRKRITRSVLATVSAAAMLAGAAAAQAQINHPMPQVRPADRTFELSDDGTTSFFQTGSAIFPEVNPFTEPTPSNMLPTIYENARDSGGDVIPNTLPSTPEDPYNLHPDPVVTDINPTSQGQDLRNIIKHLEEVAFQDVRKKTNQMVFKNGKGVLADGRRGGAERTGEDAGDLPEASPSIDRDKVQMAIDILEGNPVPNRVYSGIPLLHYKGPESVKVVDPETKNVTVHQLWGKQSIESDTMFIDPSAVLNETWTITYVIDVMHRGHEDFAPFVTYWDDPNDIGKRVPNVGMDQTFFPMEEGKRYVFKMKMAPGRYWNLTYHWGWRVHPPRIQAIENATKVAMGKTLPQWESDVFGETPSASEESKLEAISMLSDLAPAKRMWTAFRKIREMDPASPNVALRSLVRELRAAYEDWSDRTKLPRGVEQAEGYDLTLVYLNNTIYGTVHEVNRDAEESWRDWETRGETLKVKLYNGDYFPHAYVNVDFGGLRGYENTFQNTLPVGGQGQWFTFGRAYWFQNTMRPTLVPGAVRPETEDAHPGVGPRRDVPGLAAIRDHALANPNVGMKNGVDNQPDWLRHPGFEIAEARTADGLGEHNVHVTYRYEPSIRLRFYQFDPLHHNVNIWSVH